MEYTCEFKRENGNVNKHVNNFTCRFLSKYSLWVLLPFWADTAHLHTHTHTQHTSIIIPLPCASWIFPWHGAISSSNKKPASLKLVSLLANYTEAPGRTGKTSGTSFTGHYSDPTTETTQTHSPSHVNQAFQDVTLTTGGVSLCDFFPSSAFSFIFLTHSHSFISFAFFFLHYLAQLKEYIIRVIATVSWETLCGFRACHKPR